MSRPSDPRDRRRARRAIACLGAAALFVAPVALASSGAASAAGPLLKSASIPNYPGVVENAASHSLYVLSTEKGAKLKCTAACLSAWHPLLVASTVKKVSVASGVKGAIGFVKRSATRKQVTVNTFPVYTYTGDPGANQSHGESVAADGGTWHLVRAAATSAAATPIRAILNAANVPSYSHVLERGTSRTLYLLSVEKGGTLTCNAGCLSTWIPLTVTSSTTSISLGKGVEGTIGFVTRGGAKQVTFNSYPVYTFTGDTGPNQSTGEGIAADGGTWYLVDASATSAAATPVTTTSGGTTGWST